jgi:hypothetical protein
LDERELSAALDLQRRSYGLLRWVEGAITRGFVSFDAAHAYMSEAQAAAAWIRAHYDNIPPAVRPDAPHGESLMRFANVFASYLLSSFDIVAEPGNHFVSRCGCYCPCCAHLVAASHLRPKKLDRADKHRARVAMRTQLVRIARQTNIHGSVETVESILDQPELREKAALVSWAAELLRRTRGEPTDTTVLALWRQFAWTPEGSPRKDFEPRVDEILAAQRALVDELAAHAETK